MDSISIIFFISLFIIGLEGSFKSLTCLKKGIIPFSPLRKKEVLVENRESQNSRLFYVPPDVGPDIYIGAIAGVIPFIWATYQFTNRIKIQRECAVCGGSGLVMVTKSGKKLERYRKCWNCGGLLPWISWKMFFISSIREIGNGGTLQQPAKDYEETNKRFQHFNNNPQSNEEDKINKL